MKDSVIGRKRRCAAAISPCAAFILPRHVRHQFALQDRFPRRRAACGDAQATIEVASADASARSYWRVHGKHGSAVVMDAPPGSGDLGAWLDVDARLRGAGLNAPEVLAEDR